MNLPNSPLFASSLAVGHNAFKNILFRAATLTLNFVVLQLFAFIAFRWRDYTSFLIFGEDIIQKAIFVHSKGYHPQAFLVSSFIICVVAAGFYDTLLWGLDDPGFVLRREVVDGNSRVLQMANSPAYINYISANLSHPDAQNDLNTTFNTNLFEPGLNFTLPGIITNWYPVVYPPLQPLRSNGNGTLRFWLDDSGFSVGLDPTFMAAGDMDSVNSTGTYTTCYPSNTPGSTVLQGWNCNVPDADGLALLSNMHGRAMIQWDGGQRMYLEPQQVDNPWKSLGQGAGTAMMKQVFTVTKGGQRHTFLMTVYKATMLSYRPNLLDDAEIADFMERTWYNVNGTITNSTDMASLRTLTDIVLHAKGNDTGTTFGLFDQLDSTVMSASTEYLNVLGGTTEPQYSALRYVSTNITLIRSEDLPPFTFLTPLEPCPGVSYANIATGGVVRSTNCHSTTPNADSSTHFLGQVDTSAVVIINSAFLGDGTSNLSSVAVSKDGFSWVLNNEDQIDRLLLSRAIILGGHRQDVTVYVQYTVPAISSLQLILCLIPIALSIVAYFSTRRPVMSYFKNSFLAAVLATTHTRTSSSCKELGYIHSMPEISLQRDDLHVTIGMPGGRTLASVLSKPRELAHEPLMHEKDETSSMLAP